MKQSLPPAAFLSYVHDDDTDLNGRISYFGERLSQVVRLLSGKPFPIWQDRGQINWGDSWRQRIDSGLESSTFFLPVITPAYFESDYCRREFEAFLRFEAAQGRQDLILPLYLIEVDELAREDFRKKDSIARVFLERQYADWREFVFEPRESLEKQFQALAQQIKKAVGRVEGPPPARPPMMATTHSTNTTAPKQAQEPPPARTEPPTFVVDLMHRGDFTTIAEAIAKAPVGARILIRPGVYEESIVLDKPLELIGDGPQTEIIVEAVGADVILFKTTMGRVANLTLRQRGGGEFYGVDITQGRLDLEDCDIQSHSLACVAIHNGAAPRLLRNRIHNCKSAGVFIYENGRGTIEQNDVYGNSGAGIAIKTSGDPVVRNNRIYDQKESGVFVYESGCGTIEQNDIYGNTHAGIVVRENGTPAVRNNKIYQNGYEGIWIYRGGRGTYENNTLNGNKKGAWDIDADCLPHIQRSGNIEE